MLSTRFYRFTSRKIFLDLVLKSQFVASFSSYDIFVPFCIELLRVNFQWLKFWIKLRILLIGMLVVLDAWMIFFFWKILLNRL